MPRRFHPYSPKDVLNNFKLVTGEMSVDRIAQNIIYYRGFRNYKKKKSIFTLQNFGATLYLEWFKIVVHKYEIFI